MNLLPQYLVPQPTIGSPPMTISNERQSDREVFAHLARRLAGRFGINNAQFFEMVAGFCNDIANGRCNS